MESVKRSGPKIQFGLAQRDASEKLFISIEHEKAQYGKESPGLSLGPTSSQITQQWM